MFVIPCPVVGAEVLRGPRSVLAVHNTAAGIVADVRCQCGQVAVVVTGQLAGGTSVHHPEAATVADPEMVAVGA